MSLDTIKKHFQTLNNRDRKAVILLTVFFGIVTLCYGVILPGYNYYVHSRATYSENRDLFTWITANSDRVRTSATKKTPSQQTNQPLLQTITTSAEKFGLKADRLQPEGENKLRLWLNEVPFDKAIQWLSTMANQYGIAVQQISVEKTAKPGLVNIQCAVEAGN